MFASKSTVFQEMFDVLAQVPDPRKRVCAYPLDELLFTALCGVTSGANSWVDVTEWARMQLDWLKQHLPFAKGIASHDTFSRVFSLLNAKAFEACFTRWMQHLCPVLQGELIAIDGKSLRRSHNGDERMTHLVSAWHHARGLVLAQVKTAAKSNEITAIPELIAAMDVQGATLTIDAMGCHHGVVDAIVAQEAHYIIAVKNNQPNLAQAIENLLDANDHAPFEKRLKQIKRCTRGHGRAETRSCVVAHDLSALGDVKTAWQGLRSVARIDATRSITSGKNAGKSETERRYYISSLALSPAEFEMAVRAHWSIENSCHWVLDMTFSEDDSRIRVRDGAENFAILRRIALNLIKQEKSGKASMNTKRLKAGWNTQYLDVLLGVAPR